MFFLLLPFALAGQTVLRSSAGSYKVQEIYHYSTEDRDSEILEVQEHDFDPLTSISLGFDKNVHWFRFDLLNKSDHGQWYLEVAYPQLDHIEVYSPDRNGDWQLQFSGDLYPLSGRPVQHRNFVFPVNIRRDITSPVIIKVMTSSSIQLPLTIWSPEAFHNSNNNRQFFHGVFFGIMVIMILYNLLLYFSIRDWSTLLYAISLLAGANIIAFLLGYGFYYAYPEHPEWNALFAALSAPFFIIASIALTRSFLDLKQKHPKTDRSLIALAVVTVAVAVLTLGKPDAISYGPLNALSILDFAFIMFAAIQSVFSGFRPARLFLAAWSGILVLGTLVALQNLGLINSTWLMNAGLYIVVVLESILLSLAMSERINELRLKYQDVKDRQLQIETAARDRLEQDVALRTEEIARKHMLLEETNAVKDKLFSVVSHDLKGPLKTLRGIMDGVQIGALSKDELQELMKKIGEQLNLTSDFLDNLLQWSRTQLQGESFVPRKEKFSIHELIDHCTKLLGPEFDQKRILLKVTVNSDGLVFADRNMIETVVRNLVSNALKFTKPGGRVEIIVSRQDELVRVDVRDNGVGIPADSVERLFTLQGITTAGTREEKGTGIGLVVCKEFVERNNGRIKVSSNPGVGSMFSFTLPAPGS